MISSACNVGNDIFISDEFSIYELDPSTGNLSTVCDLTGVVLVLGLSSVPSGFPNYPCQCTTNAGTIPAQPLQNICSNTSYTFPAATDTVLDGDDLLQYILFSNPSDTAGSIVAVSATPSFDFAPPMQTGVTYYAAAMAGNSLNGNVDLTDPCLDFSNARPIVWRPLPTVSFSTSAPTLCVGTCVAVTASFAGTPPYSLTYTTSSSGPLTIQATNNTIDIQVCAGTLLGPISVQAIALVDSFCTCN